MKREDLKKLNLSIRKNRIRSKVHGSAERPRLSVKISNRHIHCQIIDDDRHSTIVSASTVGMKESMTMTEKAEKLGSALAAKAKKAKLKALALDRNGRKYHGRIKALAESLRKEGMEL